MPTISKITFAPPGPRARKLMQRELEQFHQPSIDRLYPIFTKRVKGAIIEAVDGIGYFDLAFGSGSMPFAGANPELVKVVKERVEELVHAYYHSMNEVVLHVP